MSEQFFSDHKKKTSISRVFCVYFKIMAEMFTIDAKSGKATGCLIFLHGSGIFWNLFFFFGEKGPPF